MSQITKNQMIELIRRKAEKTYTKAEVDDVFTSVCEVIEEELCNGNEITLSGVGHLGVYVRPGRMARNPRTGEQIEVDDKMAVKFRPNSGLRSKIAALNVDDFRGEDSDNEEEPREPESDKKPEKPASGRKARR